MGLGVFVKKSIDAEEFNSQHQSKLKGLFSTENEFQEGSHLDALLWVHMNGKKGDQKEWDKRHIYGPISFINCACEHHGHLVFDQKDDSSVFVKMANHEEVEYDEDGEENDDINGQLFVYYGDDYYLPCPVCKAAENK